MSAIFCSNLSDFDRQIIYLETTFEAEFQEAMLALEMVNQRKEINCLKAEARVILESGTEEDLLYLYTEADKEESEKEKGIFGKIFSSIGNFLSNLWNGFIGLFKKQDKNVLIENANKKRPTLDFTLAGLNGTVSEAESAVNGGWVKIAAFAASVAAVGGIGAYLVKKSNNQKTTIDGDNVEGVIGEIEGAQKRTLGIIDKLKSLFTNGKDENAKSGDDNAIIKVIKGFSSMIGDTVKKLKSLFNKEDASTGTEEAPAGVEGDKPVTQTLAQKHGVTGQSAKERAAKAAENAKNNTGAKNMTPEMSARASRFAARVKANQDKYGKVDTSIINASGDEVEPMDTTDTAMMECATLEELEALINSL